MYKSSRGRGAPIFGGTSNQGTLLGAVDQTWIGHIQGKSINSYTISPDLRGESIGHQPTESRGCACSFGEEGCWEEPSARKEQLRMMSKEVRTGA